MALNSSNSNAGSTEPKIGAGALSNFNTQKTESKSNGNFSGGDINFDTSKLSINNPFNTNNSQQPTFNLDGVFTPTVSGNLGINTPSNNSSNTTYSTYSNNSTEPTMTVDEVYGKSNNQPVVEKQGDYATSSNEKSNVETSTFGKQDEISVTPTSVTENKGMIGNGAIQSVEGLNFQQKDKASQEVLDSKKKRDGVEAEDKADNMRNKLKGDVDKATQQEGGKDFNIGNDDIDNIYSKASEVKKKDTQSKYAVAAQKKKDLDSLNNQLIKSSNAWNAAVNSVKEAYDKMKTAEKNLKEALSKATEYNNANGKSDWYTYDISYISVDDGDMTDNVINELLMSPGLKDNKYSNVVKQAMLDSRDAIKEFDSKAQAAKLAEDEYYKLEDRLMDYAGQARDAKTAYDKAVQDSKRFEATKESFRNEINSVKAAYENGEVDANTAVTILDGMLDDYQELGLTSSDMVYLAGGLDGKYLASNPSSLGNYALPEATTVEGVNENGSLSEEDYLKTGATQQSGAETSQKAAMDAIENSKNATPEQKAQAKEVLTNLENSRQALEEAAAKARSGNPADMVAYQEALEKYNKNLKEAQKIGNRWTQTDFNEDYTRAVAQANDFKVTLADGTEMYYSDFATEEATKSPQYAKAMYEAKAAKLEKKHPILAKIERWKAEMSQTWLGSKLTLADNKVIDQFNQMAKTDMRATYAAYNNVLNDPNASPEAKAEASTAINQAKALMTASAALQASTGFLSGIGDGVDDGTFGKTDPEALNAWQKTLNTVDNLTKITLGLGISPAANKAYQNMYYMAGAKVNESGLFTTDFDGDGFVLCQEYGNNAATGMIAGAGELGVGVAMLFNPASASSGLNLIVDAFNTFNNGLYGVRNEAEKSQKYTQEVLEYFKEAEDIAESSGNEEAVQEITNAITQIENFELKADEVGNLDNWLEGSGSNTASNEKFNQALTYDEWLKLIEADPVMRDYAKSLAEKKKKEENAQKDNADTRVNS